jgi:transposase
MTEGVGISEAARRLSVLVKTLENWVRSAKTGKLDSVGQHQKPLTEIEAELGRVKRELAEVKVECDLLKKFATYFAVERTKECQLSDYKVVNTALHRTPIARQTMLDAKYQVRPHSAVRRDHENPRQSGNQM